MNKKDVSLKKEECCGCGICAEQCPVKAIKMQEDAYGFFYPKIEKDICIECGRCIAKCAFVHYKQFMNMTSNEVYAAAVKERPLIDLSASGGIFAGLAKLFISEGGVVFGAAWQNDFTVKHIGIDSINDLSKLQGSKYIQSDIHECLEEIEKKVKTGRPVLFSGTPCQVATVKSYIGSNYSNFYTIDLICHGVGSNMLFQEDIAYLENKYKSRIKAISFRSKSKGWGTSGDITLENHRSVAYSAVNSPYYYYYLGNAIFRDSCYHCPYATGERVGDITIGDYWGIETAHPDVQFDIDRGVSCLLVNSHKGVILFNKSRNLFSLYNSSFAKISERNGQLVSSCKMPDARSVIIHKYMTGGYTELVKYWEKTTLHRRVLLTAKNLLPKKLKVKIKQLIGKKKTL